MATSDTPTLSRAEQRRQHTLDRRAQTAAEVVSDQTGLATRPALSFAAETLTRAFPQELLREGLITFDQQGQPKVAQYDPRLLAGNPQRGRVVDRGLEELAASLDAHGQQEPLIARLITETDRQRWPDSFTDRQLLLILKGHRLFFAQPKSKLQSLRVELMLPSEREDDLQYSRRALRRAAIKVMHSQAYDIFDKVNQYHVWCEEFTLMKPKDSEVAAYFEVSRTEAQRLKAVAQLDKDVAQDIINSDRRPADEVVYLIANRPPDEHREAYQRFGHLTVTAARTLQKAEAGERAESSVSGAGRPRNYVLSVRNEESDITYISTAFTLNQWKRRGGSKAFWNAIRRLANDRELQDRLQEDLD
jgi:hypothetical protein